MHLNRGFTLVELMITIAIIGILAGALFPSVGQYLKRSRDAGRITDVKTLTTAIDAYLIDTDKFPDNDLRAGYICSYPPPLTSTYFSINPVAGHTCNATTRLVPTLNTQTGGLQERGYLESIPADPLGINHNNGCIVFGAYCYSYSTGGINYYAVSTILEGGSNAGNIQAFTMSVPATLAQFSMWSNTVKGSGSGYVLLKRIN